jgi:ArsR family transcriptional regulator, arsenate/arsenite/antimonite-responsive transcriptional repressor
MESEVTKKTLIAYKALSDETRLHIVYTVAFRGKCGTRDCSQGLDLSQPTLSHHIKILIDANILHVQKEGTSKKYSLNQEYLDKLGISIRPKTVDANSGY